MLRSATSSRPGRGGAGKTTAAARLGVISGLPVIELDSYFWNPDLTPMPMQFWIDTQERLAAGAGWIMDGDLGPHDWLATRLAAADTVLILDFSLVLCVWRAARRSGERAEFWWWLVMWRYRSRPAVMKAVADNGVTADVHILRTSRGLEQFFTRLES